MRILHGHYGADSIWHNISYADLDQIGYDYTSKKSVNDNLYFVYSPTNGKLGYLNNDFVDVQAESYQNSYQFATSVNRTRFVYCVSPLQSGGTSLAYRIIIISPTVYNSIMIYSHTINELNDTDANNYPRHDKPELYAFSNAQASYHDDDAIIYENDISNKKYYEGFYNAIKSSSYFLRVNTTDGLITMGSLPLQNITSQGRLDNSWEDLTNIVTTALNGISEGETISRIAAATLFYNSGKAVDPDMGSWLVIGTAININYFIACRYTASSGESKIEAVNFELKSLQMRAGTFIPILNSVAQLIGIYAMYAPANNRQLIKVNRFILSVDESHQIGKIHVDLNTPDSPSTLTLFGDSPRFVTYFDGALSNDAHAITYCFTLDTTSSPTSNILRIYSIVPTSELELYGEGYCILEGKTGAKYVEITTVAILSNTKNEIITFCLGLRQDNSGPVDIFTVKADVTKRKIKVKTIETTDSTLSLN